MKTKLISFLFNTTLYKAVCVCVFILVPSIVFCFFPQVISAVLLLWGAVILLHDLFSKKNFSKSIGSIILFLFVLGYTGTLIFYVKEDVLSTFNVFFWAIVQFFLLFAIDCREKKDKRENEQGVESVNEKIRRSHRKMPPTDFYLREQRTKVCACARPWRLPR